MIAARFILWRALKDWSEVCAKGSYPTPGKRVRAYYEMLGFSSAAAELEAFFRSPWCEELADASGGYLAYLQTVQEIKDSGGDWHKRRPWVWTPERREAFVENNRGRGES